MTFCTLQKHSFFPLTETNMAGMNTPFFEVQHAELSHITS